MACLSKFFHIAEDAHLVLCFDKAEIVESRLHACGVGVVCVNDEFVVLSHGELAAVVGWHIFCQGMADVFSRHSE